MAKGNFGERLRRERELREVSLDEISVATKISGRYLSALENEDWSRLPGGVFTRGFVRSIARYLGLDEESLLGDYDLARSKLPAPAAPPPLDPLPWRPPRWAPPLAGAILFLLLLSGLIYAWMQVYVHHRTPLNAVSAVIPAPQPAASSQAAAPAPTQLSSQSSAAPPASPPPSASDPAPQPESAAKPPAELSPAARQDVLPTGETPGELKLSVSTSAATRVRVLADGQVQFDALMPAGENLSFTASTGFTVSAQNSSAVLLELNGQTMPPIGSPGLSGTIKLSRKNLRQASHGTSER